MIKGYFLIFDLFFKHSGKQPARIVHIKNCNYKIYIYQVKSRYSKLEQT